MAGAAELSKRERVLGTLRGEAVDRPPISLWGHFPSDPHRADDLAAATLEAQRRYDWDFVKLMPSGMYYPEALGCALTPAEGPGAVNGLADSIIKQPADWDRLPVLDPAEGWLAEHVRSVGLVRAALGPDVPIIQTLFSPLTVAHKLCLHLSFEAQVQEHRDHLEAGLRAIAAGSRRFAEACLAAGADGFFFATQEANHLTLSEADFLALGKRYDLEVLQAIAGRASFVLLHVCRTDLMVNQVADYPVHAINWDSHATPPAFGTARQVWPMVPVGGLDRYGALLHGTPAQVADEVRAAVAEAGSVPVMISAGCALPVACPEANLLEARRAVEVAG
jgi:uroporphyrinogen decarboxylase